MFNIFDKVEVVSCEFEESDNYVGYTGIVVNFDDDHELNVCVDIKEELIWFNDKELELVE